MAEILSKKATVKNISPNPVMIHPVGGTHVIKVGESFTGEFPLWEITAMNAAVQYDVTEAAGHKSAEPSTDDDNAGSTAKPTAAEKKAAKAANALPAAPVAPVVPAAPALPSALQLPGSN